MKKPVKFGKYYLLDRINIGGMAEVFRARAFGVEGFEKDVAIKRILSSLAKDKNFTSMFIEEAKIASQLTHANIAQIYDLGKIENSYFIALEYISGKELREIMQHQQKRKKLLPVPMSVYITSRICEGLDYAHRKKNALGKDLDIVHRDISPQNVMLSYDGDVKIIDFGIAKAIDRASDTTTGIVKGKRGYMSPEQVRSNVVDRRSDIFSAGIILYELLTGERLFSGESITTLEKIRDAKILPPTVLKPNIPIALEKIVLKALAKDPEHRYQFAGEMQQKLQQFMMISNTYFNSHELMSYMHQEFNADIERDAQCQAAWRTFVPEIVPDRAQTLSPALSPQLNLPDYESSSLEDEISTGISTQQVVDKKLFLYTSDTRVDEKTVQPSSVAKEKNTCVELQDTDIRAGLQIRKPHKTHHKFVVVGVISVAIMIVGCGLFYFFSKNKGPVLTVTVNPPNAQVFLDTRAVGSSSPILIQNVCPGQHIIEAKHEKFKPYHAQIEISEDQTYNLIIDMVYIPACLEIVVSPPDATVKMDGEIIANKSPIIKDNIMSDQVHEFSFEREGYIARQVQWKFKPWEKRTEVITLTEITFDLEIDSIPQNAWVFLNDKRYGRTPLVIKDLKARKEYQLRLELSFYEPWIMAIQYKGKPVKKVCAYLD